MCPNAAYTVRGSGIGTSQCWVLPGTGVPPPQALISPSSVAADFGAEPLADVGDCSGAVTQRPGLAGRAGQFRRRPKRHRDQRFGGWCAVGQSQPDAGLVRFAGAGGEQVVVNLHNQQAAGLQLVSDVLLEEGLGGAGGPGVDPGRRLLAFYAVGAEAGPALARCGGVLGVGRCRVLRWDREDDGVMHHRRVLGLELASGQERRRGQVRIE